ncbi:hypothetical protein MJO28_005531 [Puccinia striiformis f. sp. tritici]|uniref:Uncharacterized protein n=1 Tax=Puccinia striiformis f. sp. tritici TaxID=168172 RepID=A0ACC0EMJ2_9BASI|nr:hypothetical protein MJO28_005531 [Puccinia striiformis f. sp. tritici]
MHSKVNYFEQHRLSTSPSKTTTILFLWTPRPLPVPNPHGHLATLRLHAGQLQATRILVDEAGGCLCGRGHSPHSFSGISSRITSCQGGQFSISSINFYTHHLSLASLFVGLRESHIGQNRHIKQLEHKGVKGHHLSSQGGRQEVVKVFLVVWIRVGQHSIQRDVQSGSNFPSFTRFLTRG